MEVKQNLSWEGESVLNYRISLPDPPEQTPRLIRYLGETGRVWTEYWEEKVYPRACRALCERRAVSRVFRPWTAQLTGELTCQDKDLYSMKLEARELRGNGRPCLVCWGELWDLAADAPLPVENLFTPGERWKKRVLEQILASGAARQRENLWFPDEDWREKVKKSLHAVSPWVEEKTVFWSFPQGFMANPGEGTPIFTTEREAVSKRSGRNRNLP